MKKLIAWGPIVYGIMLVVIMVVPYSKNQGVSLSSKTVATIRGDYWLHFAVFTPFLLSVRLCRMISFRKNTKEAFLWIGIGLLLAVGTECLQYYVPYRAFNPKDIYANVLGVMLGTLFMI